MKPKISIIIPTYNRDILLENTLTSLQLQSFKDFEVVVCDDGGTTGKTKSITKRYNKYFPIRYYKKNNKRFFNPAEMRNLGVNKSLSNYILLLDCDIILPPNTIKTMYSWITKYPYRKRRFHVTPKERINISNVSKYLILNSFSKIDKYQIGTKYQVSISCCGLLSKEVFENVNGMDSILFKNVVYGDNEFAKRIEVFMNNKVKIIPISIYHINNTNIWTKRELYARKRGKYVAKQLIKHKFKLMNIDFNCDTWEVKRTIKSENFYIKLLQNKSKLNNISKKTREKLNEFDKTYGLFNKN